MNPPNDDSQPIGNAAESDRKRLIGKVALVTGPNDRGIGAAVVSMINCLDWELAVRKIRVVGVAPAMVATPIMMPAVEHLDSEGWKRLEDCHPLGLGSPHDVASAVAFLASDEARWITGVTLPLGWCSRQPLPVDVLFDG